MIFRRSTISDSDYKDRVKDLRRKCRICAIWIFLFLVLLAFLITCAVLWPTKPRFVLLDATVVAFNVTAPSLLTSTFQVTVRSTNPNANTGIYYDRLLIFASYSGQQITPPTAIPTTYQDKKGVNIWSSIVTGMSVSIAPFMGATLKQDQTAGNLQFNFKMDGRLRWKVGTIVTGAYHLHVNCQAFIPVGNNTVKYQLLQGCSVSV